MARDPQNPRSSSSSVAIKGSAGFSLSPSMMTRFSVPASVPAVLQVTQLVLICKVTVMVFC